MIALSALRTHGGLLDTNSPYKESVVGIPANPISRRSRSTAPTADRMMRKFAACIAPHRQRMKTILHKFKRLCDTASDINEHLPTLSRYAQECDSAIELGVRGCVSSWAIAHGLLANRNGIHKRMFLNDVQACEIGEFLVAMKAEDMTVKFEWKSDLLLRFEPDETFDLVFIDTWHVYGQIRRELEKFGLIANKYIIMHDTTVDEVHGETLRDCDFDHQRAHDRATVLAAETSIPKEEILQGMWLGIQEFLAAHPEWHIKERFFNNNGLTVLARK